MLARNLHEHLSFVHELRALLARLASGVARSVGMRCTKVGHVVARCVSIVERSPAVVCTSFKYLLHIFL